VTDTTRSNVDATIDLFKQWKLLADHTKAGPIRPKKSFDGPADRNYQLKSGRIRKFLQWEDQIGMNIGWTDDAEPKTAIKVQRWFFTRDGTSTGPIHYGESIAIGNGKKPSFLCYEVQRVGVNLQWKDNPCFQWQVLGGQPGAQVKTGEWLALYNDKAKECFIFVDRTVGGDVGWPSSQTWGEQASDQIEGLAGKALDELEKQAVKALISGAMA
jgi:hypothetical protein